MRPDTSHLVGKALATLFGLLLMGLIIFKGDEMGLVFVSGEFKYLGAFIILILLADMWRTEF